MWLFLAFLIVPLIEIALFIQVGGAIGLWPTLAIVVGTAIAGAYMVRSQGFRVLNEVRGSFEDLNDPTEPLAHGAMILFSGALLLTPGFFTDTIGFALLIPAVRAGVFQWLKKRVTVQTVQYGQPTGTARNNRPDIIDGDYQEVDIEPPRNPGKPSGWTRH